MSKAKASSVQAVAGRCDYCKQVKPLLGQNQFGLWYCGDACWTRTRTHTAVTQRRHHEV